ncbi:dihydroorotate dehydrogenase [Bacillus sp. FJAT-18017]|uniref:dihydroorotate dehydrogenase n=1 Tax=Bacillus sp. FJAT-18017 TaxID=1705566 RepID=UPI0006AF270C|nr:dihydroorotate dehydrogenase [Bacillus sp. FJAT-18017]ALC90503.1 dihydroorotate dehydrogenase [Bacillus sp. FJAT-18017]
MPDWSYHPLFKPLLTKLPPAVGREFIHRGMSLLSSNPLGERLIEFLGHMSPSRTLQKHFFDTEFSTPVGLAGAIDPELSGLKAFQNLGFGFIEVGPVSMEGTPMDNTLHFDEKNARITGLTGNSISLETAIAQLHSLKMKKVPFFIRVRGNLNELNQLCESLLPYGDAFILESEYAGSPAKFSQLRDRIGKPFILTFKERNLTNLESYKPDGLLIEGDSCEQIGESIERIKKHLGNNIPVITSGGVNEPADALLLLEKGASLIMLGQEYIFTGPGLPKRINEAYCYKTNPKPTINKGWIWYWLFGMAILIGGFVALYFSMTDVILPYDESFLGIFREDILSFSPEILYFMAHDRMTLAGTMISGGILYIQLARHGIRYGLHWARKAVNIAGIIGFLGILLFIGYGYFDWLHGLFWLILLPLFIMAFLKTKDAAESPVSTNLFNTKAWKLAMIGQLCFVVLGAALAVGGLVISTVGVSNVFVPSDLQFLCLSPEMLDEFNNKLIPVIAHDRAGFGSALLSVGLLVLMLALWGIREGERWVWWTFTIGAIPAFIAGIATHFIIGYTDFFHLLPAYFAFLLYLAGVICTAPFLYAKGSTSIIASSRDKSALSSN